MAAPVASGALVQAPTPAAPAGPPAAGPPRQPARRKNYTRYVMGGLAAMGAGFFSNPIDVMKTRLQLQGELQAKGAYQKHYRNLFHSIYVVAKNEGLRGVQKGLVSAVLYQALMNGTRLGVYDFVRERYMQQTGKPLGTLLEMVNGAFAGVCGAIVGSPLYLVKTQIQSKCATNTVVGYQHHHQGTWAALVSIYRKHGVAGLFQGVTSSVPRLLVASAVQLATYTKCKSAVKEVFPDIREGLPVHAAASMVTSVFVVSAMNPFDVLSVRMYNQPLGPDGRGLFYSSWFDCVKKMARQEGLSGFYKGVTALYARLGPHTVLLFVFWEQLLRWSNGRFL